MKQIIKDDWQEVTLVTVGEYVQFLHVYYEESEYGEKIEGGSSSFSLPIKELKKFVNKIKD